MADLSYAQLKGIWLASSEGTRYHTNAWASLMAAIAEAESGGDATITNPNDNNGTQTSWGLWQISNGTHTAPASNWADPYANARLAIAKLNDQGLSAWGTYDSGAYKSFLSDKTAPDTQVPQGLLSAAAQSGLTASIQQGSDCAWSLGNVGLGIGPISIGPQGSICVLSKSQVRALAAVGVILVGLQLMLAGAGMTIGLSAVRPAGVLVNLVGSVKSGPRKLTGGGQSEPASEGVTVQEQT